jgi:hypothetical protein
MRQNDATTVRFGRGLVNQVTKKGVSGDAVAALMVDSGWVVLATGLVSFSLLLPLSLSLAVLLGAVMMMAVAYVLVRLKVEMNQRGCKV